MSKMQKNSYEEQGDSAPTVIESKKIKMHILSFDMMAVLHVCPHFTESHILHL